MKTWILLPALLLSPLAHAEQLICVAHDFSARSVEISHGEGSTTFVDWQSDGSTSIAGWELEHDMRLNSLTGRQEDAEGLLTRLVLSIPAGNCKFDDQGATCENKNDQIWLTGVQKIEHSRAPVQREDISKQVQLVADVKLEVALNGLGRGAKVTVTEPSSGRVITAQMSGACRVEK